MFKIELNEILPLAIEVFSNVYGKEYHDIISKKSITLLYFNILILLGTKIIFNMLKDVKEENYHMNFWLNQDFIMVLSIIFQINSLKK